MIQNDMKDTIDSAGPSVISMDNGGEAHSVCREDWVFTLLNIPFHIPVVSSDNEETSNGGNFCIVEPNSRTTSTGKRKTLILRQKQPYRFKDYSNRNTQDAESTTTSYQPFLSENLSETEVQQERAALLQRGIKNPTRVQSSSNPTPMSGIDLSSWTFESPCWSIESYILMRITYCYAWESIPEYTNITTTATKNKIVPNLIGNMLANVSCCCTSDQISNRPEYFTETYTASDIVGIDYISKYYIHGIGECNAVRIQLRQMYGVCSSDDVVIGSNENDEQGNNNPSSPSPTVPLATIPKHLQGPFRKHLNNMKENQRSLEKNRRNYTCGSNRENNKKTTSNNDDNAKQKQTIGPVLIFALASNQTDPPLLWKVFLPSTTSPIISLHTISVFDGGQKAAASSPTDPIHTIEKPTHIYINGWQSWSFTGSVEAGTKQPKSALPLAYSRAFNFGGSKPPTNSTVLEKATSNGSSYIPANGQLQFNDFYQSDFYTCITSSKSISLDSKTTTASTTSLDQNDHEHHVLDEYGGPGLILGWLSQREQFGVITANKDLSRYQMHASAHGQMLVPKLETNDVDDISRSDDGAYKKNYVSTDWSYAQLISPHSYDEEPMANYLHSVAEANHSKPCQNGNLFTGWCSWYVFYQNITASILRENIVSLATMRKSYISTNVTVVDDGYMTAWGDWDSLKPDAFPPGSGLDVVSSDISTNHMRPGLWLAPFAADKHSQIVKEHPDWIIRNDKGIPANSSNCGKFFYGLDATNPAVREHAYECVRRAVQEWNFTVLKIDFLYAACLEGNGKYDLSMSRAQAMDLALQTIRNAAGPDVYLIGCGCPLASGIGYVDAMRISADTGPTWYPSFPLPYWDNSTLPSLRAMIRNSISRAPLGHRWWHNDPDCLMLGKHTSLTDEEVASAATVVAMTCGLLLLSDDLPKISPRRLQIISKIFPLTGVTAIVLDLHNCRNDGLPSLMRLWCTDRYMLHDSFHSQSSVGTSNNNNNNNSTMVDTENSAATFFARHVSFTPSDDLYDPSERKRSCIHVTKGMGTWSVISISNWSNKATVVQVPLAAITSPPQTGWTDDDDAVGEGTRTPYSKPTTTNGVVVAYHVFGFWSERYTYVEKVSYSSSSSGTTTASCLPRTAIRQRLLPHETEVFHIKEVTPVLPQYIGSSIHFSCGHEVRYFHADDNSVHIHLKTSHQRSGSIYVFIPRQDIDKIRVWMYESNPHLPSSSSDVEQQQHQAKQQRQIPFSVVGNTPTISTAGSINPIMPSVSDNGDGANNDRTNHHHSPRLLGRVLRIPVVIHADHRRHDGEIKIEF